MKNKMKTWILTGAAIVALAGGGYRWADKIKSTSCYENKALNEESAYKEGQQDKNRSRKIIGAAYSFASKNDNTSRINSAKANLESYLKNVYSGRIKYSITTSEIPRIYITSDYLSTIEGIISGSMEDVVEIKEFVDKGFPIGLEKSHLAKIYGPNLEAEVSK